jgi:hypothetical protein
LANSPAVGQKLSKLPLMTAANAAKSSPKPLSLLVGAPEEKATHERMDYDRFWRVKADEFPMIACSAARPSVRAAGPGCRISGDLIS